MQTNKIRCKNEKEFGERESEMVEKDINWSCFLGISSFDLLFRNIKNAYKRKGMKIIKYKISRYGSKPMHGALINEGEQWLCTKELERRIAGNGKNRAY